MTKDTRRAFASVFWFTLALVATPTAFWLAWHRPFWGMGAALVGLLAVAGVSHAARHERLTYVAYGLGFALAFITIPLAWTCWAWPCT